MRYTTHYDIGDRKRGRGINEDSLAITVFEQGHRDGYRGQQRARPEAESADEADDGDRESHDDDSASDDSAAADDATEEDLTETPVTPGVDEKIFDPEEHADGDETADEGEIEDEPEGDTAGESDAVLDWDAVEEADAPEDESEAEATAEERKEADADEELPRPPANRSAGVFVLADGAGGHDAGDAASYIATTVISEHLAPVAINTVRTRPGAFSVDIDPEVLPDQFGEEDIQTGLRNAIVDAHREIIRYADASGTQSFTTVVAGVYADGKLHLGWVGDSRAYLVNSDREELVRLTKDHAVVEEMEDEGDIDAVEAHVHPNGNEITRALGGSGHEDPASAMVDVETRSVELFAEDTVLVTSDGLIDAQTDAPELYQRYVESGRSEEVGEEVLDAVVTDDEIRDVLLSAADLDGAAAEYVRLANERGGKDNISVLLFEDPELPSTPAGGLPVRAADPDIDVSERQTVIFSDE